MSEYASGGDVVCQPCLGELRAVLGNDCEVCEDVLALTYDHYDTECWRIQCKSGCPIYSEGATILDVVKGWEQRHGPFLAEVGPPPKGVLIVDDPAIDAATSERARALVSSNPHWQKMVNEATVTSFSTLHHESELHPSHPSPSPWWHFWRWPKRAWVAALVRLKVWRKRRQHR